eukprot:scaffold210384_cov33-Tisochrysis_lutea.AAC.3
MRRAGAPSSKTHSMLYPGKTSRSFHSLLQKPRSAWAGSPVLEVMSVDDAEPAAVGLGGTHERGRPLHVCLQGRPDETCAEGRVGEQQHRERGHRPTRA